MALCIFKYYNFIAHNLNTLANVLNTTELMDPLAILLPIGLSFHTFQAMSYTIEVYRGHQPAERDFVTFALYVMFYPQLVAGPIERPQNLLPQFHKEQFFVYSNVVRGLQRMAVGMFKKVVIADNLAMVVDQVYRDPQQYHGLPLVLATLFFSFQIYYDFSGYSDIAVGAAEVMGIRLMENFRTPYFSLSLGEFWRRWHISLSTWFKDYLYVPLGGSRVPTLRHYANLLIVFLASGLWHGANWTFVVWGLLHGAFLIVEDATSPMRARVGRILFLDRAPWIGNALSMLCTFLMVSVAWVFFRASSLADAVYILGHMSDGLLDDIKRVAAGYAVDGMRPSLLALNIGLIAFGIAAEWIAARGGHVSPVEWIAQQPLFVRYGCYFMLIYSPLMLGASAVNQQFIYFQF